MLRVKDIMTPNPVTAEPTNSVRTALRLMEEGGFHHLPIVKEGRLVGMVHAHDIRRSLGMVTLPSRTDITPEMWEGVPLSNVMQPVWGTVTPDTPIEEAVHLMRHLTVTGLPVVKGGALVGIVTANDVLRLTEQLIAALSERAIPPVVCFVGRSGSGKTTLIERLIEEMKRRGYKVGVLKHHFHATFVDQEGKDTWRYEQAGGSPVGIIGPVQTALFFQTEKELPMDIVLARHYTHTDIVLVEGFHWSDKPKIEVHRQERSDTLQSREEDLLALVSDREWDVPCPRFHIDDIKGIADFLEEQFLRPGTDEAPSQA